MQGQFVPTCKNEICEDQNKWRCSGLNSEPYGLECRMPKNECHKPLRHAAINILNDLYLLGTLSRLGISFPNRNYFIWPTYMITIPQQVCDPHSWPGCGWELEDFIHRRTNERDICLSKNAGLQVAVDGSLPGKVIGRGHSSARWNEAEWGAHMWLCCMTYLFWSFAPHLSMSYYYLLYCVISTYSSS